MADGPTQEQIKAFEELAAAAVQAKVEIGTVTGALGLLQKTGVVETLQNIQNLQVSLATTVGDQFKTAIEGVKDSFQDLNSAGRMLGIGQEDIKNAFATTIESFKFTGEATDGLAKKIAANSKVIEGTKLVAFTKDFALQTQLSAKQAELFGEKLTATAIKAGLPRDELLKLSQSLLTSGVTFGSSISQIETLTTRTTAFGRSLGVTGDAIRRQLGAMMTIGDRQQLAARLSQIGTMVGADVDVAKLMSADPAEQEEALRQTLNSFSQSYQQLQSPAQKRALMLTLSRSLRLPAQAVQTALSKGVDISKAVEDINKAKEASEKGIQDNLRRTFVTTNETLKEFISALKQQRDLAAINAMNTALEKVTGATVQSGNSIEQLDKNIRNFAQVVETFGEAAGKFTAQATGEALGVVDAAGRGDTAEVNRRLVKIGQTIGNGIGDAIVSAIRSAFGGPLNPNPGG